jgi:RsiW-degrading membrane proteinase PrsW (M82 family)
MIQYLAATISDNNTTVLFALVGGIVPAIIWLAFWLAEDKHPEPKFLIGATFLAGMVIVPLVAFLERNFVTLYDPSFFDLINGNIEEVRISFQHFITVFGTAGIEELFKFLAAFLIISLHRKSFDEPIDAVEYLITAALGFAALENVLYLYSGVSVWGNTVGGALFDNNLRFIGATILHVTSSGLAGVFIALSFYKRKKIMIEYALMGLLTATLLHTFFNFFIIESRLSSPITIFSLMWAVAIVLLFLFERIKSITNKIKPLNK